MYTIIYISRSIVRNLGRSILFIATSFSLICFSGMYLSSILGNEHLLKTMGEKIPVKATLTNPDGSREVGLSISTKYADGLINLGVTNPILTAESYGNIDREKMNIAGDTISVYLMGTNTIEAFAFNEDNIQMHGALEFLAGEDAKCIINSEYAKRNELNLEVGSVLEINLFKARYDEYGDSFEFVEVTPVQLIVAGFYSSELSGSDQSEAPDIICPVKWLRQQYEIARTPFEFNSVKGTVADPLLLNDFKAKAEELNLKQVDAQRGFSRAGVALLVSDKVFIEAASLMMRNARMLRLFLVPVVFLVFMLVTLISFFLTRSRRQEISIAQCLGTKKASILLALVLENCLLALTGGLLAAFIIIFMVEISLSTYLLILLLFICCELAGSFISAFMLTRVNPMELMVRVD